MTFFGCRFLGAAVAVRSILTGICKKLVSRQFGARQFVDRQLGTVNSTQDDSAHGQFGTRQFGAAI
jgi:hypothetical protein